MGDEPRGSVGTNRYGEFACFLKVHTRQSRNSPTYLQTYSQEATEFRTINIVYNIYAYTGTLKPATLYASVVILPTHCKCSLNIKGFIFPPAHSGKVLAHSISTGKVLPWS